MPADQEDLLDLLNALIHALKAELHASLRDSAVALAPMEARALRYVARHPGATQSDFVQYSGRDKAQVARLIGQLLDRGLLTREPDPADRRNWQLTLTEAGLAEQKSVQVQRRKLAARMVEGMSAAEQAALKRQLAKLLENVAGTDS